MAVTRSLYSSTAVRPIPPPPNWPPAGATAVPKEAPEAGCPNAPPPKPLVDAPKPPKPPPEEACAPPLPKRPPPLDAVAPPPKGLLPDEAADEPKRPPPATPPPKGLLDEFVATPPPPKRPPEACPPNGLLPDDAAPDAAEPPNSPPAAGPPKGLLPLEGAPPKGLLLLLLPLLEAAPCEDPKNPPLPVELAADAPKKPPPPELTDRGLGVKPWALAPNKPPVAGALAATSALISASTDALYFLQIFKYKVCS
mmetsp:Transcript_16486/g.41952  ORF Transcript_16486/g.41952 Transcript_16486/m.41952 type:complete len:253 (-) Transcript_16486:227-985(-)